VDAETLPSALDPGLAGQPARPVPGIDHGYLAGYRVRFDEAGADNAARTSALLRYAQDIAWRHSEDLGFDRDWYAARGLGWVVRAVELELHAAIPMGHTLRVSTAVIGHRRIWARRLGECRLADGRLAARVTTDWVLLDGRGRIVRIPDDFGVAFANPEIRSEILRVAPLDGTPVSTTELRVRPADLDPLDHVNNAVYADWLDEQVVASGLDEGVAATRAIPRRIRLEYARAAERGATVVATTWRDPDAAGWSCRVDGEDGTALLRARLEVG
jgi:acyl-ACP thioesterase